MDSLTLLLNELFTTDPALQDLKQRFQQQGAEAWLVGGCLRDLLLNRTPLDIDIATIEDPSSLAQGWARQHQGHWFWLDADRLQSRVILPSSLTIDFSPLRAASITGDLNLRDFTINALALPLTDEFSRSQLIDPLNGRKDLSDKLLVFCSSRSIVDDPLRMLKGVRHATTLRFDLSDQARQQIESETATLDCVAGERLRDELAKILSSDLPGYGFELLYQTGLLKQLFGRPVDHWRPTESFARVRKLDLQLKDNAYFLTGQQDEVFSQHALFLLAIFLRDYSPAGLEQFLHERLRLSRKQQRLIVSLQNQPNPSWCERLVQVKTLRQKALLAEQLGPFPAEQLHFWSCVDDRVRPELGADLVAAFRQLQKQDRIPDLLDGCQLGRLLQSSGKQTGVWLQRIKQAEIDGEISTGEDVAPWLQGKISD